MREIIANAIDEELLTVELMRMLSPFPASEMKIHSASNSVTDNDSADLFVPVNAEVGQTPSLFWIASTPS